MVAMPRESHMSLVLNRSAVVSSATYPLAAAYLAQLPDAQRETVRRALATLESADQHQLWGLFDMLARRACRERELLETYLFAPSRWGITALHRMATDLAHPGLRHLGPTLGSARTLTWLLYREAIQQSDVWLMSVPAGFRGRINAGRSSVVARVLTGRGIRFTHSGRLENRQFSDRAAADLPGANTWLHVSKESAVTALLVASPALAPQHGGDWLTPLSQWQ